MAHCTERCFICPSECARKFDHGGRHDCDSHDSPQEVKDFAAVMFSLAREQARKPVETYRNPTPTVDVFVKIGHPAESQYVLIRRKNPPYGLALPGGFVNYGESCEQAAVREVEEETGLKISSLEQFHTYSDPNRDPRSHIMTTVFIATAWGQTPKAADDAAGIAVVPYGATVKELLAFDHRQILEDIFKYEREKNAPAHPVATGGRVDW
jgi:8-oxo-dGTP diphosphatase